MDVSGLSGKIPISSKFTTGGAANYEALCAPLATLQTLGYNLLLVSIQDVKRETLKGISHFTFHVLTYRKQWEWETSSRKILRQRGIYD
jgi:hypothetical protein